MRRSGLLLLCMLGGCDESSRAPVTGSPFNPVQFFTGHTAGEAKLSVISGATRRVTVDSMGSPDGHGGLTLNQKISEEGKASRARTWLLQPAGTNHWTGTLTDAKAHPLRRDDPLPDEERPAGRATSAAVAGRNSREPHEHHAVRD